MPKTVTITRTLYTFDELSDEAKEKARYWARDWWYGFISEFLEYGAIYDDAATIGKLMGIEINRGGKHRTGYAIYWSGFSSQGDGACFEGSYRSVTDALTAVKGYAPQDDQLHAIAAQFDELQDVWSDPITATIRHRGHYFHEMCTDIEVDLDTDSEEAAQAFRLGPYTEAVTSALRAFMRWIYRQLEAEYDYRMSDEAIDEDIKANEYTFDESGQRLDADDR